MISQENTLKAFYSRKLNPALINYTEQKLFSVVETLKELRNIFLVQQVKVDTDHKTLTYKSFNLDILMRWRLTLEEFSPRLIYIKCSKNIVAEAISCSD